MKGNDLNRVVEAYAINCAAFDREFKKQMLDLYLSDLSGFSADQIVMAFNRHRLDPDRGRFFPKVADLIYQITGTEKQQAESLEHQAELEWAQIYRASANGNEPKNISIEALSALRSIGGSSKVGYSLEKDIPFLKRDFIALFKSISQASASQLDESLPCYPLLVSKKTQVAIK